MANNQPTVDEKVVDQELDALKGKVPGLEDEPASAAPAPQPAAPAAPDKKDEGPNPNKKDSEQDPEDEDEDDEDDDKSSKSKKPGRPEKYIPITQYTDEKKRWNESLSEKESRIAELESALNGNKDGSKKSEAAIKAYAEKYGVEEDSVRELAAAIRATDEPAPYAPDKKDEPKVSPEDQQRIDKANEILAEKAFNEEYSTLAIPELKTHFPNATPEQLEEAKKEIEQLACTKQYLDKSLDFVVYKNKATLSKIFDQGRKGPETARQAPDKGKATYAASDFASGKTKFDVIGTLPQEEQVSLIESMDLKTYERYTNWVNQNDELAINRNGRRLS